MILIFFDIISGELESTLLKTSACSANLHAILADDEDTQQIVCEMANVMDTTALQDARGFRLARILNPDTPNETSHFQSTKSIINEAYFPLLLNMCGEDARMSAEATFLKEVSIRGVCYAIHESTAYRNSYIQFQTATAQHGKIEQIMKCDYYANGQQLQDIFLVIRQIIPIEDTTLPVSSHRPTGAH